MEQLRQFRIIKDPFCISLIATSFMAITVVSTIIAYCAYTEAAFVSSNFGLLKSPYPILGFMFSVIAVLTTILLLFVICTMSVKDVRSKVWKKAFCGMAVLTIFTFISGFWAANTMDHRALNDTVASLRYGIVNYQLDNSSTRAMDAIQITLSCCGINGYEDWKMNSKYACASKKEALKCGIPPSCCRTKQDKIHDDYCGHENLLFDMGKRQNRVIPIIPDEIFMYTRGCLLGTEEALHHCARAILFYIIFLLLIQMYSMIVIFNSKYHLKNLFSKERNTDSFEMNSIDCPTGVNDDPGHSASTHVFCHDPASTQSRFLAPSPTYMCPFTRSVHFENEQDVQNLYPVEGAMGHEDTVF